MMDFYLSRLLLLALFSVIVFPLHNSTTAKWRDIAFIFIGLLSGYLLSRDGYDLIVFIIGMFIGYVTDFIGVHRKYWRYNTKNGYNNWVGVGWGIVTLILYQIRTIPLLYLGLLALLAGSIILKDVHQEITSMELNIIDTVVKLIFFLVYPTVFILGFSIGVLIEFIGVELFHIWKYQKMSYLQIGTGYSMAIIVITTLIGSLQGTSALLVTLLLLLSSFVYFLRFIGKRKDSKILLKRVYAFVINR